MPHIFKPGEKAYWLRHTRWIYLIRNRNFPESCYSLGDQETHTYFTLEGKLAECNPPELLPLNPYDPSDPNNPPGLRSEWPFLLRGRRLEIGMEIFVNTESGIVPARIHSLEMTDSGFSAGVKHLDGTSSVVWSPVILFPDELPIKKKVADWMCAVVKFSGEVKLYYAKGMTEEDVKRIYGVYGSIIQMVPGTEREIEG